MEVFQMTSAQIPPHSLDKFLDHISNRKLSVYGNDQDICMLAYVLHFLMFIYWPIVYLSHSVAS